MNTAITGSRVRKGMVLPLVLVALVLVFAMSASLQQTAWRAARGASTQWNAQRAMYSADQEVIRALAEWSSDALAATPVGQVASTTSTQDGWRTDRELVRTAPLAALVRAVTTRDDITMHGSGGAHTGAQLGDATRVHREVWRAVTLEPPAFPIPAAATFLGPVTWGSATLDGRDLPVPRDPNLDDCGPLRDTLSTNAAFAPIGAIGTPVSRGATLEMSGTSVTTTQRAFDDAWSTLVLRARNVTTDSLGGIPFARPWQATVIHRSGGVTVDSNTASIGLLAVDGELRIRGIMRVDGLLLVRGALRVESGALIVRGALLVRDASSFGSILNAASRIEYAPCLVGRALSAAAVPRVAPFRAWNSP